MSATEMMLKMSLSSQIEITRMVGDGKISMQAGFIMNYMIIKSVERLMGACPVPASEIRHAMGVKSPAIGYKYLNEAIDAGLLQAFKSVGLTTVYRPRFDNILQECDPFFIGSDTWVAECRARRKDESAEIIETMHSLRRL